MKKITIVAPTYNEEDIIKSFLDEVFSVIKTIKNYQFDVIIIDNNSSDNTQTILRKYAKNNKKLKLIFNIKNFGHIRSPYWGVIQSKADATIYLASDLQEPPSLIPKFIQAWESGFKIVYGVRQSSEKDPFFLAFSRKFFYALLSSISASGLVKNATGFGLYDKKIIEIIKNINDPYPYFRGLVADIGYPIKQIKFIQKARKKGKSKNNFSTLYDMAILGIVNYSYAPLRICSFIGMIIGSLSLLTAFYYLLYKIFYWESFDLGIAPLIILSFFIMGIILFFLGILGEYIISVLRYVNNRPIVIEKERINFVSKKMK